MAVVDRRHQVGEVSDPAIQPGPHWDSFEQLRVRGLKDLQEPLQPRQIGWLKVKDQQFVLMNAETFHRLYGLAQDTGRLSRELLLIRQAVDLLHSVSSLDGQKVAMEHLRELTSEFAGVSTEPAPGHRDLIFDDDELANEAEVAGAADFELDPTRVARPRFEAPR